MWQQCKGLFFEWGVHLTGLVGQRGIVFVSGADVTQEMDPRL